MEKSGRHTYGLDQFYNGKTQRPERGLELSVVAIVDLEHNTGYTLSAQQTKAGLPRSRSSSKPANGAKGNRIDFYLGHLAYCLTFFPTWIRYIVADGFYSKYKWVTGVVQLGFHAIGKLRCDANLKFLYEGPYQGRGAPRRFEGKVNLQDHRRFQLVRRLEDGVYLYSAIVWSVSLKRNIRLAYLLKEHRVAAGIRPVFHRPRH